MYSSSLWCIFILLFVVRDTNMVGRESKYHQVLHSWNSLKSRQMLKLAERENENCLIDRTHYLIIFLVVVVVCQANDLILGGDLFFVFVVKRFVVRCACGVFVLSERFSCSCCYCYCCCCCRGKSQNTKNIIKTRM